jgi:hypothetical protein
MTDLSRIAPNGDEKTPTTHAVLARSNHNKHPTQKHAPRKIIEKPPRVILT